MARHRGMTHRRLEAESETTSSLAASTPLLANDNDTPDAVIHTTESPCEESTGPIPIITGNGTPPTTTTAYSARQVLSMFLSPFTDQHDSPPSIVLGLSGVLLLGTVAGVVLPKSHSLPATGGYRILSNILGYMCFTVWSVSFYPQMIANCRRRTTAGLSVDFCALNVLGFACYTTYNLCLYWNPEIRREYHNRYGALAPIAVQSNDVAFAVHSLILSTITLLQIAYYDGLFLVVARQSSQRPSRTVQAFLIAFVALAVVIYPIRVFTGRCEWLDYLYMLSFVKIVITVIKYVPQVVLNYQRKSTTGFSIWQILLDVSGGILNNLQLILDAVAVHQWSSITGNPAKLCLGGVSIAFDVIFIVQHYFLYHRPRTTSTISSPVAFLLPSTTAGAVSATATVDTTPGILDLDELLGPARSNEEDDQEGNSRNEQVLP